MTAPIFSYDFKDARIGFTGKVEFSTGLFIDNKFVNAVDGKTQDLVDPTTGKHVGQIAIATEKDIDIAVKSARHAFENSWGLKVSGMERSKLLFKLADLIEKHADELAALESLDSGKAVSIARGNDVQSAADIIRYYGGWADKIHGKTIEVDDSKFAYTRHEPIGVVGAITPWNFPIAILTWKLGPALACGNTVLCKASEFTPLTTIRLGSLIAEAGFPPGVVNIVTGLGSVAGSAMSNHMDIDKISFTGSTLTGRHILKAAASSNLKKVTLELGGKSPTLILNDANLEQAVRWAAFGILFNQGQVCSAGSRVYVQEDIYDEFIEKFTATMKGIVPGNPFHPETFQGPQVSQIQYDRIMNYIDIGKKEGATLHLGGERHGEEGFFIQPTIFTDVTGDMTIVKEEIFGPVVVVAKFKTDEDLIHMANDSLYGLAAAVFSENISRGIGLANKLKAGTVWINSYNMITHQVPFGGYKQSGIGRDLSEYALASFTEVKAVHINLTGKSPI